MRYYHLDTNEEKAIKQFVEAIGGLHKGEYLIEVKKKRAIRSLQANKYLRVLYKTVAMETGHTEDEIEHMFKMARHYEIVYYPSGKEDRVPKRTANLDTKEFAAVINNFQQWTREEWPQIKFKKLQDTTYEDWMEVNNRYEQTFSGF